MPVCPGIDEHLARLGVTSLTGLSEGANLRRGRIPIEARTGVVIASFTLHFQLVQFA